MEVKCKNDEQNHIIKIAQQQANSIVFSSYIFSIPSSELCDTA